MYFKHAIFKHEEQDLHRALDTDDDMYIRCRERIFFVTILGYLLCIELYGDVETAPGELTTVTGDLDRLLSMITDEKEYDLTLLHFMSYRQMAKAAVRYYHKSKDKKEEEKKPNIEDKLKQHISDLIGKAIKRQREGRHGDRNNDVYPDFKMEDFLDRLEKVKLSNRNFDKYMRLMGFQSYDHSDVDDLLRRALSGS